MILVDTSAWIDYLRDARTPVAKELADLIDNDAEIVTTEPITMELLAGADTAERLDAIERLANGLPLLSVENRIDYRQAAAIYVAVRRNGQTVRSLVDCLIATVAIRHDVPLLHKNVEYVAIASSMPLRLHEVADAD